MAAIANTISTRYGRATVTHTGLGQTLIHRMANWMWAPMLLMGAVAVATGVALAVAQSSVGADLGEEFTALRQANFETLGPLRNGFLFLGEAMILTGISFLLGTILGVLRWGGGEVQEQVAGEVKTLQMPLTAKIFVGLMMVGLILEFLAFGTLVFVATQFHSAWIGASAEGVAGNVAALNRATALAAWANPLREVALGVILAAIGFALYTISNVLGFQFSRIREIITGQREL